MAEVLGRDALIYFNLTGIYREYGCAESISISFDAELIETSTVGTGKDATYDYQKSTYSISLSGLVQNESLQITAWDLFFQQRQFLTVPYRIIFTDTVGNIKSLNGYVVIPNITMSAEQTDFMTGSIQLQGTGEPEMTDEVAVPIITIETVGAGTGAITSLILRDPATLDEWSFVGSIPNGNTETWVLDGVSGRPGPGEYYIEFVVSTEEDENHLSTDAPPTANVSIGAGAGQVIDTAPYGNTVIYDFTQSRTITFTLEGSNTPPVADAGDDQTIELPTNIGTLDGTGSNDPDGTIVSYLWEKISGPAAGVIVSDTSASTVASGLEEGTYVFRLTVTDSDGATDTDTVTITVEPEVVTITILITGAGVGFTGFGGTLGLYDQATSTLYTSLAFSANPGDSLVWTLDGVGGNPLPGNYEIRGSFHSDEPVNSFSTDAPPTITGQVFSSGFTNLNSFPGAGTNLFDFTTSRTVTFNIGS